MNKHNFEISIEFNGLRLDKFILIQFPEKTRNFVQKLIKDEEVTVNQKIITKNGYVLRENDEVEINIPKPKPLEIKAQNIPLGIIYEDKNILIINKQPNLVVHPSESGDHQNDSLVNAVLHHCKSELSGISGVLRPGIVHRLDKDTSGILMIAKNDQTHQYLSNLLQTRQIKKTYLTLVKGILSHKKGRIEAPIGRSLKDRKKMAVINKLNSRMAMTDFEVLETFDNLSLLKINLITGRTHQIRVHFSSIGHPVMGDPLYGDPKINKIFKQKFQLKRQFLHAHQLELNLLNEKEPRIFTAPLYPDLDQILKNLKS